jgi:periplasmic divalent cation tolerance protein
VISDELPTASRESPVTDYVLVLTTLGATDDAETLAATLVEERVAACVSILPPMTSIYRWRGSVDRDQECQLIIKSSRDRLDALRDRLLALHPYEVPELLVVDVAGGADAYLEWLASSTRPAS